MSPRPGAGHTSSVAKESETIAPMPQRAMTLPGIGLKITFKGLTFVVQHDTEKDDKGKRRELHLLKDLYGFVEPKQMCALMGPSGSGKTTLLDLLAGRKTTGRVQGEVLFGGQKPTRQFLRRYTGYVEQFDTLLPILTVQEMLLYTAELKRPRTEPLAEKRKAVEALLQRLSLDRCANVRIGSQMARGISGGQAKRTNIAVALITNPRVLFLDEPTTGLDSYTANEVMKHVQELACMGITVCATVHSPTAFCFSLFDRLMMLVRGRLVYFGPQDATAVWYFHGLVPGFRGHSGGLKTREGAAGAGGVSPLELDPTFNPAEYLVDMITEADRDGQADVLADAYASSTLAASNAQQLERYLEEGRKTQLPEGLAKELSVRSSTVTPWWWGIRTFLKYRTSKNYVDPTFLMPRIMDKGFIGLLVMTLYLGIGDELRTDNIINIAAMLFCWSATTGFVASSYIPSLVMERGLFVRERNDGLYLVPTYLAAKMFDELLINCVASLGIAAFTFYGIQLQGSFWMFWITYFVAVCVGIILAYFVAAISPNMDVANALLPIYAITLMFFAGFLIRVADMQPWWYWYSVIDYSRYAWGEVMINQFKDYQEPFIGSQTVLQYYSLYGVPQGRYLGYTSLFFIVFYVATLLALTFRKYQLR